ncbi:MAG: EAL domain-containing protein [Hyphomicrobiales bacterium]|nr:EAL domain-containing protein [Hyphomicrobiales bacterium]
MAEYVAESDYRQALKIRAYILAPFTLLLLALLVFAIAERYHGFLEQDEAAAERRMDMIQRYYHQRLQQDSQFLGAAIQAIATNDRIMSLYRQHRRADLAAAAAPVFAALRSDYGVTRFYFTDPDRRNFLRVHQPRRHGDFISRYTTLQAARTGQSAHGLELGVLGTLTLRYVTPVKDGDRVVGFIELGKEIDDIIADLHRTLGVQVTVEVDKVLLDRSSWTEGMAMLGREADWGALPGTVLVSHTTPRAPITLLRAIEPPHGHANLGGHHWDYAVVPITDVAGRAVGRFTFLYDGTAQMGGLVTSILWFSVGAIGLGGAVFVLFHLLLGRVQAMARVVFGRLDDAVRARTAELSDEVARHRRTSGELLKLSQAVEQSPSAVMITDVDGAIEYVNPQFTAETGFTLAEAVGRNPRILKTGRTTDRQYANMWQAITGGDKWHGEFYNRKKTGDCYWVSQVISPIRSPEGDITHFVSLSEDISVRRRQEEELLHQANHDPLTDLPNRLMAMDRLTQACVCNRRRRGRVAVLFLDLDMFNKVNDTFGHEAGDRILVETGHRLARALRDGDTISRFDEDTVARFGGDEFLVLLDGLHTAQPVPGICQRILDAFRRPFSVDGAEVFVSISIGVALSPDDGEDAGELLRDAAAALNQAKDQGRDTFRFFEPAMNAVAAQRVETESLLRHALEKNEIFLEFQPLVDAAQGRVTGAEALVRWRQRNGEVVPPGTFIPLAEETGQIFPITEWILVQACREAAGWPVHGETPCTVSVNVSPPHFLRGDLVAAVRAALDQSGLAPQRLFLEVTENILVEDSPAIQDRFRQLLEMGVRFSIDDFGTGYSALSYLRKLSFSVLKIDQSFVRELPHDRESVTLIRTILAMARGLELKVVAEGVENEGQLAFLRDRDCDLVQGFYFSRPLPAAEFLRFVAERNGG